jgi:hypothetical protein
VSASFAVSGNTFRSIGSIFGLGGKPSAESDRRREDVTTAYVAQSGRRPRPGSFFSSSTQAPLRHAGRSFTANFNYQLNRSRPERVPAGATAPGDRQSLGFSTSFSPTAFWALSWSSQYNITDGVFEDQSVRLERELHEWRAAFSFLRNTNGNFAFYFTIYLTDLPELKFDYDQTTIDR